VLTEVAIIGKRDERRGLKENVMVGRLISAGTRMAFHQVRKAEEEIDDAELCAIALQEAQERAAMKLAALEAPSASAEGGEPAADPSIPVGNACRQPRNRLAFFGGLKVQRASLCLTPIYLACCQGFHGFSAGTGCRMVACFVIGEAASRRRSARTKA
jgi:hypothetical protein